jgi:hypothetical protein
MKWLAILGLVPALAFAQTVKQPFSFLWDWLGPPVDRFELKLDAGLYMGVGVPSLVPMTTGTYRLLADPTLTGAHSAVVRACTLVDGCSPDSNTVAFVVGTGTPAPIPAAPTGLKLVANISVPPPVTTESPNLTKVTASQTGDATTFKLVGSITDSVGGTWALAPKDPAIEGGIEFVVIHNGSGGLGAALYLCYHNHIVGQESVGNWYDWNGTFFQNVGQAIPAGC